MILLIDIGNSRIKWAFLQGEVLHSIMRVEYSECKLDDDWFAETPHTPDAIFMISVASKQTESALGRACHKRWGKTAFILQTASSCAGVTNGYSQPSQLGVDRWAAMVGAYRLLGHAALVIDCGTACTADLIDDYGIHRGGAIIPGLQLMRQSLSSSTARIRDLDVDVPLNGPGTTTAECMHVGIHEAVIGFIERMTGMAQLQLGEGVSVIVTGGGAMALLADLPDNICYEKELVFIGMAGMVTEKGGSSLLP